MRADRISFFGCAGEYRDLLAPILARTAEVLASGQVLQGPEVAAFEGRVAALSGRAHAVAVGSGTDALFFSLIALGIGAGDEVLVPDLSFLASATAVARTGARPIFVDIDETCNLDLEKADAKITRSTKAIVFVQLFGGMTDPARVEEFGEANRLTVVEDCAQSLGARHGARPGGGTGTVAALSFDPTKVLGAPGSGGAVVTDDARLAARVRRLRLHGKEGKDFVELGYNSQLSSLTAAVLDLKLDQQATWVARRQNIAARYLAALDDLPISTPHWDKEVFHVRHKFVLHAERRDALMAFLDSSGIPTMIHYARPLHREPIFASDQHDAEFPVAIRHSSRALSLPIHGHLTDREVDRVIAAVSDFFS